ncbi:MAG: HlyD family secretion protein [Caulobacterales bacterium]
MDSAEPLTTERPSLRPVADPEPERPPQSLLRRLRWPLMLGGPLVILAIAAYFVLTSGRFQSTDDAYVQASRVPISASIGGRVTEVDVQENQPVKAGQVLFRIDTRDYATNLEQAEAQLAAARLQVQALRAAYQQQLSNLSTARTSAEFAVREAAREKALMDTGVSSRDQYETAAHAVDMTRQQISTAQSQVAQAQANLGGPGVGVENHPMVMQAQAAVDRAKLNLSYGVVVAPSDGVVTRVVQLPAGSYINPAQTLFWLVSGVPWVEANFKEDQLKKMRVGEPVTISVDSYGGQSFAGHVASFSPGTGQAFSPLPAQNATGNWVKVVQRLPVRIDFDRPPPDMAGRAGLSARVKVDVRPVAGSRAAAGQ